MTNFVVRYIDRILRKLYNIKLQNYKKYLNVCEQEEVVASNKLVLSIHSSAVLLTVSVHERKPMHDCI